MSTTVLPIFLVALIVVAIIASRSYTGGRPVATAQNLHARVQMSPRIMNVAVPAPQHSPIFGHLASSHTVLRRCSRTSPFRRK